ncbi:hypothetical protein [Acinetobacter bereziniae]|uniref:hypothetical protein n=1 Tax=Acinetobacter bereziniae TaxID=106648 RepID=UPI0018DD4007|nr:hypothetical protein [Acinetobacter bereziniae]MBI0396964.1 hypothetical protein [Acinetobacter bereziniae]MBJ8443746.1 hypothetical protein [Acinetobacter bereziniae]MCU4415866.1 hypothetical protein [Acinetobacter bereziniae]
MMHIDNLAEESGNISFVEYTATGIFILKIEKRKYRGTKIQSQVFELHDDVQVIFNSLDKDIYAVFNKTKQILYLNDQIQSVDHFDAVLNLRKSFSFSMAVLLFAVVVYPFYQYFMDGTIYYFDTFMHLTILTLVSCFVYFIFECLKLNRQKTSNIEALFHMLKLPVLSKRTLDSLKLTNSYFYEFDQLYDLSLINQLRLGRNDRELKTQLAQHTQKLVQFGLTQHELAKFKVESISGRLDQYIIEKRESTTAYPDALTEVRFNLQGTNFYSYLDDFHFVQGTEIEMIISQRADSTGQYAWLIYDYHQYLTIDEELLQVLQRPPFPQSNHEKYMETLRLILGFIVLVSFILFDIFAACVAFIISIAGYYYFQFCYAVFLKFSFSKDIYAYLGYQSVELFQMVNLKELKQGNFKPVHLAAIARPSRTGFNIEKRRS